MIQLRAVLEQKSPIDFVACIDPVVVKSMEIVQNLTGLQVAKHFKAFIRGTTVKKQHANDVRHALTVTYVWTHAFERCEHFPKVF